MAKRTVDIQVKQTAPIPLKVRLMGDATKIEQAANELISAVSDGFQLVERSQVYPCRPPQDNQSRIYLTFVRR
jgi:hypothetical protein